MTGEGPLVVLLPAGLGDCTLHGFALLEACQDFQPNADPDPDPDQSFSYLIRFIDRGLRGADGPGR